MRAGTCGPEPDFLSGPLLQRGPQVQGWPDWHPQPQVDGAAAGVLQPQVQDAPGQGLQAQGDCSVFMLRVPR